MFTELINEIRNKDLVPVDTAYHFSEHWGNMDIPGAAITVRFTTTSEMAPQSLRHINAELGFNAARFLPTWDWRIGSVECTHGLQFKAGGGANPKIEYTYIFSLSAYPEKPYKKAGQ